MKKQKTQPQSTNAVSESESETESFACKFPGIACGNGKSPEALKRAVYLLLEEHDAVLAHAVDDLAGNLLVTAFPEGEYDPAAHVFLIRPTECRTAKIFVVASGKEDLPAALEAKYTLCACGIESRMCLVTGIGDLNELASLQSQLSEAAACIAVAGANTALPAVVAAMTATPVIALPVTIADSNPLNGLFSLLGTLGSGTGGLTVVGCDNAVSAGLAAARIINAAAVK